MAFEEPVFKPGGLEAASDLSTKQFLALKISGDLKVDLAGDNDLGYGILQNKPKAGEAAEITRLGISKAVLGGNVTAADRLAPDANGKLVAVTGLGDKSMAIALEGGALDELRTVDVIPIFPGDYQPLMDKLDADGGVSDVDFASTLL